jgi:hypothetical protein
VLPEVELSPCLISSSLLLFVEVERSPWEGLSRLVVVGADLDEDAMPDC